MKTTFDNSHIDTTSPLHSILIENTTTVKLSRKNLIFKLISGSTIINEYLNEDQAKFAFSHIKFVEKLGT